MDSFKHDEYMRKYAKGNTGIKYNLCRSAVNGQIANNQLSENGNVKDRQYCYGGILCLKYKLQIYYNNKYSAQTDLYDSTARICSSDLKSNFASFI